MQNECFKAYFTTCFPVSLLEFITFYTGINDNIDFSICVTKKVATAEAEGCKKPKPQPTIPKNTKVRASSRQTQI